LFIKAYWRSRASELISGLSVSAFAKPAFASSRLPLEPERLGDRPVHIESVRIAGARS
jgi:hypothetical protein